MDNLLKYTADIRKQFEQMTYKIFLQTKLNYHGKAIDALREGDVTDHGIPLPLDDPKCLYDGLSYDHHKTEYVKYEAKLADHIHTINKIGPNRTFRN